MFWYKLIALVIYTSFWFKRDTLVLNVYIIFGCVAVTFSIPFHNFNSPLEMSYLNLRSFF